MRTQEELKPLALQISANAELMRRFRAVIGSENEEEARAVLYDVTKYARSLDPTVTDPEGTRIVVLLMNIVGHPGDNS